MKMSLAIKYFVILLFLLVTHTDEISGDSPKLQILPDEKLLSQADGKNLFLKCTVLVKNIELISNLRWRNPKNEVISEKKQKIYVENPKRNEIALYFQPISCDNEGVYTCEALYANNELLTASIELKVIEEIEFRNTPEKQFIRLGENGKITCEVTANPSATIDWHRNNVLIMANENYIIDSKGLTIQNVKESDEGLYSCRATVQSTGDFKNRFITAEVTISPKITKMVSPLEFVEGENVSAVCKAFGKPQPIYKWIKEDTNEDLSQNSRFSVNRITGVLTINPVKEDDESTYQCIAENQANVARESVRVIVLRPPKVLEFIDVQKPAGGLAVMACKAFGKPAPNVTFEKLENNMRFEKGLQPNDDRITVEHDYQNEETTAVMKIHRLMRSDDGLYECVASNKAGTNIKIGHLTVEFKPSFEHYKERGVVWTWNDEPRNISCLALSIPNATISWYWNRQKLPRHKNDLNFEQIGLGPSSVLSVRPNQDPKYYAQYKCVAKNTLGESEFVFELKKATRPGRIREARVESSTSTTIHFSLVGPDIGDTDNLPIKSISVQYMIYADTLFWNNPNTTNWPIGSAYVLENLEPEVRYVFRFAARNEVGTSDLWSTDLVYKMPTKSSPNPPVFLNSYQENNIVISHYNDQYELHWQTPANNGAEIDFYELEYCPVQNRQSKWEPDGSCETKTIDDSEAKISSIFMLRNLAADTHYRIRLRAHNIKGFSLPGEFILKTSRGMDVPMYVTSTQKLSNRFVLGAVIVIIISALLLIDISCCIISRTGLLSVICKKLFRKSQLNDDGKFNSLYGWRFPLPYCSYKASAAHPNLLQLPQPIKYSEASNFCEEKEPLRKQQPQQQTPSNASDADQRHSTTIEFDGKRAFVAPVTVNGNGSVADHHSYVGKHSIV